VQKVALTVARRFDEYDGERSFEAWASGLAKSRVIDHYRVSCHSGQARMALL
jgi:DNA-directed RNA polymerase specialized sigma24 family protein